MVNGLYTYYISGLIVNLIALDSLAASVLYGKFFSLCSLSETVFGNY